MFDALEDNPLASPEAPASEAPIINGEAKGTPLEANPLKTSPEEAASEAPTNKGELEDELLEDKPLETPNNKKEVKGANK